MIAIKSFVYLVISLSLVGSIPAETLGDNPLQWNTPVELYRSSIIVMHPQIVVDAYGTVHSFWVEKPTIDQDGKAVVFHTVKKNEGWSTPRDILVSDSNDTTIAVAADHQGLIHLIWYGSNTTIYHTSVNCLAADDPHAWSVSVALGSSLPHFDIQAEINNSIYVLYPSAENFGVKMARSNDGGSTWAMETQVAWPALNASAAEYVQAAVDLDNLYVVWTEFQLPNAWPPKGVFVTKSNDGGVNWSAPRSLAQGGYTQATVGVNSKGEVYAAWNGMAGVGGRYITYSDDAGDTWSDPYAVFPLGLSGSTGYPDFTFDASDVLHMVSSIGNIAYVNYDTGIWNESLDISGNLSAPETGSIEYPQIAISEGNQLHVVFEVDFKSIYYASARTNAPVIQRINIQDDVQITSTLMEIIKNTPASSPTPIIVSENLDMSSEGRNNNTFPMSIAIVAVCILLLTFFLNNLLRKR